MLRQKIKTWFDEAVALDPHAPQDLKDVLKRGHPKLQRCIDELCKQIEQAERQCRKKGLVLKTKTLQDFTYDMAKYFLKGFEGEARRRYESDLQRLAREAEATKIKDFDSVLAGTPVGEFAEAGVLSNEKIDKEREDYLEKESQSQRQKAQQQESPRN